MFNRYRVIVKKRDVSCNILKMININIGVGIKKRVQGYFALASGINRIRKYTTYGLSTIQYAKD